MTHANIAEMAQSLIAGWGFMVNLWALVRAYTDLGWLRTHGYNGPRCFWALSRIRQEWMLLFLQGIFLAMGIASLFLPPPIPPAELAELPQAFVGTLFSGDAKIQRLLVQGDLRTATLIVATVVVALFAILNSGDRNMLVAHDWKGDERRREHSSDERRREHSSDNRRREQSSDERRKEEPAL